MSNRQMVRDLKCDVLTEELEKLLLEINKWLLELYKESRKIDKNKLSGNTLTQYESYNDSLEVSMTVVNKILELGYYNMREKELLNELRKQWLTDRTNSK